MIMLLHSAHLALVERYFEHRAEFISGQASYDHRNFPPALTLKLALLLTNDQKLRALSFNNQSQPVQLPVQLFDFLMRVRRPLTEIEPLEARGLSFLAADARASIKPFLEAQTRALKVFRSPEQADFSKIFKRLADHAQN